MLQTGQDAKKIVLIGSGMVGATFAYTVMLNGLATELAIIDINREKAEGEAMDLNHGLPFARPMKIWAADYRDCAGADVVVITAGAAQKPGETRLDLVRKNVRIFKDIIPRITEYTRDAVLLIASNPVDVLTYATLKISGFPRERVIGSGTLLDTARLRYLLGKHCGVDPRSIHAYVIGEHGDSELPVWSLANVAGIRFSEYCYACERACEQNVRDEIFHKVRNAAYEIIERKGATYYAIAAGLSRLVETIFRNEHSVLSISTLLTGQYGLNQVCLGVPAVIGAGGVERIIELPLSADELERLKASAAILQKAINSVDLPGI